MNWQTITLGQYQRIHNSLQHSEGKSNLDVLVELISICEDLSIDEIDSKPYEWLLSKKAEYAFLDEMDFEKVAKSFIDTNGKRYHFVHEVKKMPAARYIEVKTFSSQGDFVNSLHKIMASCVVPMKKRWFGWVDDKYNAKEHSTYAEDMLNAKFTDVYNGVVFFCQLYGAWMQSSQDYLIQTFQQTANLNQQEASQLVKHLTSTMAGYITQKQLQSLKGLR